MNALELIFEQLELLYEKLCAEDASRLSVRDVSVLFDGSGNLQGLSPSFVEIAPSVNPTIELVIEAQFDEFNTYINDYLLGGTPDDGQAPTHCSARKLCDKIPLINGILLGINNLSQNPSSYADTIAGRLQSIIAIINNVSGTGSDIDVPLINRENFYRLEELRAIDIEPDDEILSADLDIYISDFLAYLRGAFADADFIGVDLKASALNADKLAGIIGYIDSQNLRIGDDKKSRAIDKLGSSIKSQFAAKGDPLPLKQTVIYEGKGSISIALPLFTPFIKIEITYIPPYINKRFDQPDPNVAITATNYISASAVNEYASFGHYNFQFKVDIPDLSNGTIDTVDVGFTVEQPLEFVINAITPPLLSVACHIYMVIGVEYRVTLGELFLPN